jgi:patatin-like phospholipase/acyl hydrolase
VPALCDVYSGLNSAKLKNALYSTKYYVDSIINLANKRDKEKTCQDLFKRIVYSGVELE